MTTNSASRLTDVDRPQAGRQDPTTAEALGELETSQIVAEPMSGLLVRVPKTNADSARVGRHRRISRCAGEIVDEHRGSTASHSLGYLPPPALAHE
jgi:hypothetical protein